MPTNTYVALQTQTLSSTSSSVVFSSIPQTYTDLVLVISAKNTTGQNYETWLRFNSDSASNYSQTFVQNYAGSTQSGRNSNINQITPGKMNTTSFDVNIININNYSNATTYKTILSRLNNGEFVTGALVGLWRNTAAITRIEAFNEPGTNYTAGSTFTLYGIANSNIGAPKAFGGTITQDANYTYHTFGASGTFTPTQSLTCDYLVVAGGGGGGAQHAGGGGAGGLRSTVGTTGGGGTLETALSVTATPYTITVGAGGAGTTSISVRGTSGSNSTFSSVTSTGGGGGGSRLTELSGANGGSGGGAGYNASGGTGTANQGYAGGNNTTPYSAGAGGGGSGAASLNVTSVNGTNGGAGVAISALATVTGTGVSGYYAGGGGGGADSAGTQGTGGIGGGGSGSRTSAIGTAGTTNTGSGGGGGGFDGTAGNGGSGGSGVVIIRYAN